MCVCIYIYLKASLVAQMVKRLSTMWKYLKISMNIHKKLHPYYPKQMVVKPNIIITHQRKFKYFKICFSISLKKY